jgi:hypothetical protein
MVGTNPMECPALCSFRMAFTISLISEQIFMDSGKKVAGSDFPGSKL